MQIINHWPSNSALALDKQTTKDLVDHLIVPFGTEFEAKDFWQAYPSTIVIINELDDHNTLKQLETQTSILINQALLAPEYIERLNDNYFVSLSITNDSGVGIYLVINHRSKFLTYEENKCLAHQ